MRHQPRTGADGDPAAGSARPGLRPEWWVFDSFAAYAERLAREPSSVNTLALIGHMSLRVGAMGTELDRPATDREAEAMRRQLDQALADGAAGFSTGLFYGPSRHAPTDEVIAVAEALRTRQGLYVTHMRNEAEGVLDSIEETLAIGAAVGVPVVISHHKCAMPENHGRSRETLPRIEAAARRQPVGFDVYPYAASSTSLGARPPRPECRCRSPIPCPIPRWPGGCWPMSPPNGASRWETRWRGCCRPAASSTAWRRRMCSGSWPTRWR